MQNTPIGVERPIIIKRKKKGGHGGHHGGAWKVAYADFVTAMWAFFILLWLLNTITSDQRKGIADYFAPVSVSQETSGSGGVLGGQTITVPGAQLSPSSPISADVPAAGQPTPSSEGADDATGAAGAEVDDQRSDETRFRYQERLEQAAESLGVPGQRLGETLADFAGRLKAVAADTPAPHKEARSLQNAVTEIRQAMQSIPELEPLAQSLTVDQTAEGLRIQIIDAERVAMFPSGSAQMYPQTRQLMMMLGEALGKLPNRLVITGHTDATAFPANASRDNWSLSFERANVTKRALVNSGVAESRIQDVAGRADRDLLIPEQPNSPRNRRITIVLLHGEPPGTGRQAGSP